ncbi:MAG: hypothetical protein U1F44_04620 [Coriobacteriia bacterium]|nr:hypothetical protein [Coriobacteriia bacterium]
MYDFEGVLEPPVMEFVDRHVRSLLTWDILVFFHRNPEAVLDLEGLASRLGRRTVELKPEVEALCDGRILSEAGGLIRYRPSSEIRQTVAQFVESCQDRGRRLALIAIVLHKINPQQSARP